MTSRPGCTCNPRVPGSAVVHPLGIPRRRSSGIVLGGIPPPTASHERGGLENDALPRRMRAFDRATTGGRAFRRSSRSRPSVVTPPPLPPPPDGAAFAAGDQLALPEEPRTQPFFCFVRLLTPLRRSFVRETRTRARGADLSSIFVNSIRNYTHLPPLLEEHVIGGSHETGLEQHQGGSRPRLRSTKRCRSRRRRRRRRRATAVVPSSAPTPEE